MTISPTPACGHPSGGGEKLNYHLSNKDLQKYNIQYTIYNQLTTASSTDKRLHVLCPMTTDHSFDLTSTV